MNISIGISIGRVVAPAATPPPSTPVAAPGELEPADQAPTPAADPEPIPPRRQQWPLGQMRALLG